VQALRDGLTGANAFQAEQLGKEAAATEAGIQGTTPLAIKVATGDGGPDKIYHFPRDTLYDPRHMVMFEHIEGGWAVLTPGWCSVSAASDVPAVLRWMPSAPLNGCLA
jgi:hypothetical protein